MDIASSLLQGKGMHVQDHRRGLSAGGYSYGLKGANTGVGPKWGPPLLGNGYPLLCHCLLICKEGQWTCRSTDILQAET